MSDLNDIDAVSSAAYAHGNDPIDWATWLAECAIDTRDEIVVARLANPAAYPIFGLGLDTRSVACRIVGRLLDAGWAPPAMTSEAPDDPT